MTKEEEQIWRYLVAHRNVSAWHVAEVLEVDVSLVKTLLGRISSPDWREEVKPMPPTGHKDDTDKLRYELLPPELLEETARVLTFGAGKYSSRNWESGMAWSRPFSAMMRHMWAWWGGEDKDPETGYSHLAHACCCLAFLTAYERRGAGEDDRP